MKVRVYFPYAPYPPTAGGNLVVADQVRSLIELGHEVEIVSWRERSQDFQAKQRASGVLRRAKWTLIEPGPEGKMERINRVALSVLGHLASPELYHYPHRALQRLQGLGEADLAIYHYSYAFAWLLHRGALPDEKKRVVHFHNLESDQHDARGGLFQLLHKWNSRKLRRHEAKLSHLVDELWFLSGLDAEILGVRAARIVPPTFSSELRLHRTQGSATDVVIGFIGAMDFRPNSESARWILSELAPELYARRFTGKILISGKNPNSDLIRLGKKFPFVEFTGFVDDVEKFWSKLSFLVVPHIVGSGVRTKILEAIASGIPVLTNTNGQKPLPAGVIRSPFLFCRDYPEHWADIIMNERHAYMTRGSLVDVPFCQDLKGEAVYRGAI